VSSLLASLGSFPCCRFLGQCRSLVTEKHSGVGDNHAPNNLAFHHVLVVIIIIITTTFFSNQWAPPSRVKNSVKRSLWPGSVVPSDVE
jgi:hypothetical protein